MKRRMSCWSFQPIKKADLSRLPANGGSGHPVDRFLSARLAEAGLPRAATADRRTLIRRSSYALRGLPPSPNGIEDCLRDSPDRAYERLADSFLASTRFGERWARHWMDWIRYADSHGRLGAGCGTLAGAQAWRAQAEATGGVNEHRLRQCEYAATFGATATAGCATCPPLARAGSSSVECLDLTLVSLGNVMAHEIGHLLLGPKAHSPAGIMKAKWNQQELQPAALASLRFTPQQADVIQNEVFNRVRPFEAARASGPALSE